MILELIWRMFSLLFIWLILIVIGVIWIILAWWIPYLITHDYIDKIFVRIPDLFSLHTFHTNLRQCAEDIGYVVGIIGVILLLIGICVFVYDYLTRTQKWGEIYAAEEGTVYIPTANIYDPKLLERIQFRAEPNISASQTSCELVVTIGAKCTKFFDAKELESDFKAIADSIEKIAGENKERVRGVFTKEAGDA